MPNLLDKVIKGPQELPFFLCIYSPPGVGKTQWASQAPSPLILSGEEGAENLDVDKTPQIESWDEYQTYLDELLKSVNSYKTIVTDGLDSLESMMHKDIQGDAKSFNTALGGYGAAPKEAASRWANTMSKLKEIRLRHNANIILIGHSIEHERMDPLTESNYFQYTLNLYDAKNASSREIVFNAVDAILFANFETYTVGEGKKVRGGTTGKRKIYTQYSAGYVAKNRYNLPKELDLSWDAFESAVRENRNSNDYSNIVDSLVEMAKQIPDEERKNKAFEKIEKARKNKSQLEKIKKHLTVIIGE